MYHVNRPERLIEYTYSSLKGSPSKRSPSKRSPSKRSPHKRNPYNTSQSNTSTSKRSRSVSRLVGKALSRTHGVPPFNRQLSIFSAGKSAYANPKAMSSSSSKDKIDDSEIDKKYSTKGQGEAASSKSEGNLSCSTKQSSKVTNKKSNVHLGLDLCTVFFLLQIQCKPLYVQGH